MSRYLIKNGTIYNGIDTVAFNADILIENGQIQQIGKSLCCEDCEVIDAAGCCVTPGFIDIHRHLDISIFRDKEFGELELLQGITTTVIGNCGLAPVPMNEKYRREMESYLQPVLGVFPDDMFFPGYKEFFDKLDSAPKALNIGCLAGCDSIKVAVKGFGREAYTEKELKAAADYVEEAMECGAFGASLGIMYLPECYSTAEEMSAVVSPAGRHNGILCTHIRGEGDSLVSSVHEVIDIARRAGVRLNISHFKATGIKNWNRLIDEAIAEIEKARSEGIPVTVDFYPYDGGSTTIQSLIPPSVMKETLTETISYLSTDVGRKAFATAVYGPTPGWDNMALSIGWDRILICSVELEKNRFMLGRNVRELASELGYDEPAFFVADLFAEEKGMVGIIVLSMSEKDIEKIVRLPYSVVISDGLYGGGNPHPRLLGAFPRFLRVYSEERNILGYGEAVRKMTGLPAERMNITDRGVIKEKAAADILIYKKDEFKDRADYSGLSENAVGMKYVFVNGEIAVKDGIVMNKTSGKLLRNK